MLLVIELRLGNDAGSISPFSARSDPTTLLVSHWQNHAGSTNRSSSSLCCLRSSLTSPPRLFFLLKVLFLFFLIVFLLLPLVVIPSACPTRSPSFSFPVTSIIVFRPRNSLLSDVIRLDLLEGDLACWARSPLARSTWKASIAVMVEMGVAFLKLNYWCCNRSLTLIIRTHFTLICESNIHNTGYLRTPTLKTVFAHRLHRLIVSSYAFNRYVSNSSCPLGARLNLPRLPSARHLPGTTKFTHSDLASHPRET